MLKSALAVAALVVVLAACGSSDDEGSSPRVTVAVTDAQPAESSLVDATTSEPSTTSAPTTTIAVTTTSTTVPAPEVGARSNPVPLGQAAEVGEGWTAVINAVNLDAAADVAAANQFNDPPAEGHVYVLVNATITYNGAAASDTGGVRFQALGPVSNRAIDVASVVPPNQLEFYTEVFQGGSLTGDMVFEVPVDDVAGLVLIGQAMLSFDDDTRAFFATA